MPRDAVTDIVPCLRYRDAPAAIAWLAEAFGFERHFVVPGPVGGIAHAELRLGNGLVMLARRGTTSSAGSRRKEAGS